MKNWQDASLGTVHDVSLVLIIEGRGTKDQYPQTILFQGGMVKGEVSFEQWSYELQTLRKSYSDLALREGIQHSLRWTPADTLCNMGPNVPLDMILKKLVMSTFDLLMRDFYGQIKGKMRPSPPLQLKLRGFCLKLGTGSPISFPSRRNKGYLKTTCSMEAKKASGIG